MGHTPQQLRVLQEIQRRQQAKKPQRRGGASIWIAVVLMFGAMFLFDLALQGPPAKNEQTKVQQQRVNEHLQTLDRRMELASRRAEIENQFLAPQIGQRIEMKAPPKRLMQGVPIESDRNEVTVMNDLKGPRKELTFKNPTSEIHGELREQELDAHYNTEYQRQFVERFIENARQHGYQVEINDDLVVTRVKRLPSNIRLPNSGGSGSR